MARFEIGISEKRAAWVIGWIDGKVAERRIRLGELREGLGRLQFLAGPLEHLRPFLGPLYAWACAGSKWSRPRIPVMLLVSLKYIAGELRRARMAPCRARAANLGEVFRLDAKAEGELVCVGGWTCLPGKPTRECPWFSVRLDRRNAPWAFSRGEAFRTIASLELLGALVGVAVLMPPPSLVPASCGLATITCGTDNQGNTFLLDKLMTTKYPLAVILMELSCQLGIRRAALHARWIPRLQNEEADALTNEDFRHFDERLRVPVDLDNLGFIVLHDLFREGEAYMQELADLKVRDKTARTEEGTAGLHKRKKAGQSLRERDPW